MLGNVLVRCAAPSTFAETLNANSQDVALDAESARLAEHEWLAAAAGASTASAAKAIAAAANRRRISRASESASGEPRRRTAVGTRRPAGWICTARSTQPH